jgi:hypothetical protein
LISEIFEVKFEIYVINYCSIFGRMGFRLIFQLENTTHQLSVMA